jgi:hypothetical protein
VTASNLPDTAESPAKAPAIDLRDPWLAAFLAWLVPGLGHMYQRRWGKGGLFMVCILGTFFYGLWIGGGRVVYASIREPDFREWRWAYAAQVANGLPALPAVVQAIRTSGPTPKAPLFGGLMAPPMLRGQAVPQAWVEQQHELEKQAKPVIYEYAPDYFPHAQGGYVQYVVPDGTDQNGHWHFIYGAYFDLGTVFTVIAGLLNVLAIWDAWGGPMVMHPKPKDEKDKQKESAE